MTLQIVAGTDDAGEAQGWGLTLSAIAFPHRVVDRSIEPMIVEDAENEWPERFCLVVSDEDAGRARAILEAQGEEERARRNDQAALAREATARTSSRLALVASLFLSVLLVLVFLRTPGFDSDISRKLRIDARLIFAGEWWRLFGGPLLHADLGHLFGNIAFLLPLGYFCALRLGVGHFLFGFIASAALGNVASVLWHGEPFRQVGASGGVFGVLGVLVGAALYAAEQRSDPRHRRRTLIGAALAYLGLTAFGATVEELRNNILPVSSPDMAAHVFGFLFGVGLGALGARGKGERRDLPLLAVATAAVIAVFLMGGCGPLRGDIRTQAIVNAKLQDVTLHEVTSLTSLMGERLQFYGDPELRIELSTKDGCVINGGDCFRPVSQLRESIIGDTAALVRPRFDYSGGVYHPLDYDTLALVSLYHAFSDAQAWFGERDVSAEFGPAPVYYLPDQDSLKRFNLGTEDNAAYFQLIDGFLILPMDRLKKVPFSMNRGVLFHEYFHRLFALRVYGPEALRAFLSADEQSFSSILKLRAVNEGVADFFGAVGAGDPGYVAQSTSQQLADTRNVAFKRTFREEWINAGAPFNGNSYNPYPPGSCFANLLWRTREAVSEEATVAAWFTADSEIAAVVAGDLRGISFALVVNAFVNGFAVADRPSVCSIALDIFEAFATEVTACSP